MLIDQNISNLNQEGELFINLQPHLDIQIKIAGKDLNIVPYVQNTLKDIIKAFVKYLKGYNEGDSIDIKIRE